MKTILTLLVRDEIDIIKQNLDFHLGQGIDGIIVTDNGSKDGTRELLQEYYNNGLILEIIDEKEYNFQGVKWVNAMGYKAKYTHKADHIIHSDGDEFWKPKTTYNDIFKGHHSYIVDCYNVALTTDPYPSCMKYISKKRVEGYWLDNPLIKYVWKKTCLDVTENFQEVSLGNHTLKHETLDNYTSLPTTDITVYHLPIRSYENFENKIKKAGVTGSGATHLALWYQEYLKGNLLNIYNTFLLDEELSQKLESEGYIEKFNLSNIGL